MAKDKSPQNTDGLGDDEGDTGAGQDSPDTSGEGGPGGIVAGRDDIPVDPGNSGMLGENVFHERSDATPDAGA